MADYLRGKDISAAEHSDTRSNCPRCGEWRDSPSSDCASCGYPTVADSRAKPSEPPERDGLWRAIADAIDTTPVADAATYVAGHPASDAMVNRVRSAVVALRSTDIGQEAATLREDGLDAHEVAALQKWAAGDDAVSLASVFSDAAAYSDVSAAVRRALRAALAASSTPEPPSLDAEEGIVQRAHIACCWCGEHHEEGI